MVSCSILFPLCGGPRADAGRTGRPGDVSSFIFSAGMLRHLKAQDFVPLTIYDLANHVQRELIRDQAYIFKKQPFIEVLERELEGRRGMNRLSLISIPGGLDDLFNLLVFLAGILFTSSVTWHHNTSLIFHRGSPSIIIHPGRPLQSPSFFFPSPAVIPNT